MKKFFIFAAMASVALASCVKNDGPSASIDQNAEISFGLPVMSSVTKAAGVTEYVNPFDKTSTFGVWAHYSDNAWAAAAEVSEVYMNEVEISYVGNDAVAQAWKNATKSYYWPKNGYLHFSAYAPYEAEVTDLAEIGATGVTFTNYEVKQDLSNQRDLLFSERVYNATRDAQGTSTDPSYTDGVVVDFKHALSAVNFKVKLDKAYNDAEIIVTKIEIIGADSKGTFDQGLAAAAGSLTADAKPASLGADYSSCWTTTVPVTYTAYEETAEGETPSVTDKYTSAEAIILTTDAVYTHTKTTAADGKSTLMLLPQKFTAGDKIKVSYYIDNGTAYLDQTHEFDLDGEEWFRGYRHNYTITIGMTEIFFDPEVTAWVDNDYDGDEDGVQDEEINDL